MQRREFIAGAVLVTSGCTTSQSTPGMVVPTNDPIRYVRAPDGCRIAYRDFGRRDGPPILFCTMANAAMSVWDSVAVPLSAKHRIVLHDRRGNGDSDAGAAATHTFETFRDDALRVLDAVGISQAVICGEAFGARVALRIALDVPARTKRLVLFDATGGPAAPEPLRRAGSEEAARLRTAAGIITPVLDPAWSYRRDPSGEGLNSAALKGWPAWVSGLEKLRMPTLVACGAQDPNLEGSRRLAKEIPGSRFELMPMTGHASIRDRPDLLRKLLGEFA